MGEGNGKSDTGSGGLEEGKKEDGVKTVTGNGERRGALREIGVCWTYACARIRAEFLIKLKLLIDSLRVPVLPGVPTIPDYSDFPPVSPVFLARCNNNNAHPHLRKASSGTIWKRHASSLRPG